MRSLLRNLFLGASFLVGCISLLAASPANRNNNPYNLELARIQAELPTADTLHKLVFLDEAASLQDYLESRAAVVPVFSAILPADSLAAAESQACLEELRGLPDGQKHKPHWYQQEKQRQMVLAQAAALAGADGLELRARLEHMASIAEAGEHMRQAAQLSPSAARWLKTAEFTSDPFRKFAALQAGLALEPKNAQLNLQLAVYYIGRQQLEKAQALLERGLAQSGNDFVLRIQLAELRLSLGLRSAALRDLRSLETQWPSAPPWLERRLAVDYEQLGFFDDAGRFAVLGLEASPSDQSLLDLLTRFHQRRHTTGELEADYKKSLQLQPESAELWSKLALLQQGSGNLAEARDSLQQLVKLTPQAADAHRRLAQVYARLHQPDEARRQEAQALALAPSRDSGVLAAIDLLSDPKVLAAAAFAHAPAQDDLALSDVRIQELYANGLNRVHVQQIFYVGSNAAAESRRVMAIRYSPASENVRVLHARIWKPDGSVLEAQESGESAVADGSAAMYYDMRSRRLRFAGLDKGDVAELDYLLSPALGESPNQGYFGELVTMASRVPAQLRRYVLVLPESQKIFVHAEKMAAARISERDGLRQMLWELRDVPALERETRGPGITETSPYVHVSTMAGWQELGAWYAGLIRPQFALDDALQQQLAALVKDNPGDQQKIAAIQEFVLRNTHYVALEFGIYSYKPYPVAQTYARRFGDCKDKASLMIALLRAAGIEAEIALVRTRSMGDVAPMPASIALFDHAIVHVPRYDLWLDGTAEYSGRELPLEDQGALALTVGMNGNTRLRQIPMSSAHDNYTRRTIYAQLSPEGVIHFSGSTLTRGEDAPGLRRELAVKEQQLDLFRQRLAEVFPMVKLDNVAVHGAQNLASDVSVDFQGELDFYQNRPVVRLSSTWMPRAYVSGLASGSERTQDLLLPSPWITEEEIHLALPEGAGIKEMPHNQEITTSFGMVRMRYSRSGREIVIESRLEFDKTRIGAQEYPAFRQFCSDVENSFHHEIVVGLPR
jgi:hypothetical protein